ncbi:hypothetical protein [Aureimonas glaciei]|nr:hypothetical protein [Aureimonas glaciei]
MLNNGNRHVDTVAPEGNADTAATTVDFAEMATTMLTLAKRI